MGSENPNGKCKSHTVYVPCMITFVFSLKCHFRSLDKGNGKREWESNKCKVHTGEGLFLVSCHLPIRHFHICTCASFYPTPHMRQTPFYGKCFFSGLSFFPFLSFFVLRFFVAQQKKNKYKKGNISWLSAKGAHSLTLLVAPCYKHKECLVWWKKKGEMQRLCPQRNRVGPVFTRRKKRRK